PPPTSSTSFPYTTLFRSATAVKDILLNIEAVIFAANNGITPKELREVLQEALAIQITKTELAELLGRLKMKYDGDDFPLVLTSVDRKSTRLNSSHVKISY